MHNKREMTSTGECHIKLQKKKTTIVSSNDVQLREVQQAEYSSRQQPWNTTICHKYMFAKSRTLVHAFRYREYMVLAADFDRTGP